MARAPVNTSITAISRPSKEKKKGVRTQSSAKAGELSRAQKRKERKKSKKNLFNQWCWYCDREFMDAKVLLSHQKAKHFRCPHCPRRLNTAGGLAVHIDQVHKVPYEKLENTLPGRDSFDIEIYGMEGIPKDDLAEWRRKRETELGLSNVTQAKRPKIFKGVVALEDLAKQLAIHRQLMRNSELGGGVARPPGMPPMLPGGIPLPPGFPMPPGMLPPPGFASPAPGMPLLGASVAPSAPYPVPSSKTEMKGGGVLVYGDNDVSMEEKRAKNPKYAPSIPVAPAPIQAVTVSRPAPPAASTAGAPSTQQTIPQPSADAIPDSTGQLAGQKRARAADFI